MTSDNKKRLAAARALDFIQDGMIVGLGTGSTAEHFVELLAKQVAEGLSITCVSTSIRTAELATKLGIKILDLDEVDHIDVTVDGADEIDPQLRLIKGGGGALLREKIVAAASGKMVVIADDAKLVDPLGQFALPVEVVPFGLSHTLDKVRQVLADEKCARQDIVVREGDEGKPFITDGGHYILDCACQVIPNPENLDTRLNSLPGVVDHGLFIGLASAAIIGSDDEVKVITL